MSGDLLPHRPPVDEPERGTRVATVGTGEAADICQLLSTETATDLLATLGERPAPASDVAEALDASLQTVDYHLKRLEAAGLVRVVGSWVSARGTEMKVYAPTHERLVLAQPDADERAPATPSLAVGPGD